MKIRKYKAFTLAELLVIMAVLAVLLAAFAPMFTSRYTNIATGTVWQKVPADDNGHIYSDVPNKLLLQPSFIGLAPQTSEEARNKFTPYSKVIINSSANNQKQIDFKHDGTLAGQLYARNNNILFGGEYDNNITGKDNTAFGSYKNNSTTSSGGALASLTSGSQNTAIGSMALDKLTTGSDNTAIGFRSSNTGTAINRNVTVGLVGFTTTLGLANNNNVIIRNNSISLQSTGLLEDSVVIGDDTKFAKRGGATGNVVVGHGASVVGDTDFVAKTEYNTAIGAGATTMLGSYNTSVGVDSGKKLAQTVNTSGKVNYITTIANDGNPSGTNLGTVLNSSSSNDYSHIYIGPGNSSYPAVLEVHSGNDYNSSVIVNGDLIVRGQTFIGDFKDSFWPLTALSLAPVTGNGFRYARMLRNVYPNRRMREEMDSMPSAHGYIHEKYAGKEGCVCTAATEQGLKSYDWSSLSASGSSKFLPFEYYSTPSHYDAYFYNGNVNDTSVILDGAHMRNFSCCPNITSDARLKNIGEKYTPSYDELLKLSAYNYSYKTEGKKPTHVGVVAQDLKKIFPNSVSKDEKGYYKIRWDEMFYAAINAIKDLNTKVKDLIAKVESDKTKIKTLKAENKLLEQKLDTLSKEITELEK